MTPLLKNSNIEKHESVVYSAAASTLAQAKATKRSKTHQDSSDVSEVPDAKRRKQTVDRNDDQPATPAANQRNKRGVKRRVIDEDDQFPSPPTKNKMRETTATQSVVVVNPNDNLASASRGDNDTILRNLFALQPTYRKGKLCDESKLSTYQVTKFLTAHSEKVNPTNRNSEWRLINVAIDNDDNIDEETDEDFPVLTTVDITPSLNPSSPVQETDEDGPVLTTDDVTLNANNKNSQEDDDNDQAESSVQVINPVATTVSIRNYSSSSCNTSDDDSDSSVAFSPRTMPHSPRINSSPVSTRSSPSSSSCNTSDDDSDSSVASSPRTPLHVSRNNTSSAKARNSPSSSNASNYDSDSSVTSLPRTPPCGENGCPNID